MLKFSQLISLPVINLYELKFEGIVENVLINPHKKKVEYLIVYDEKPDNYKIIKYTDIYNLSEYSIFITNSSKINLFENIELELANYVNPLKAYCYDISGKLLGKLEEISLKGSYIDNLLINKINYPVNSIAGISDSIVLISPKKQISINRFKQARKRIYPSQKITNTEPIVTILNTPISPTKTITNYNFLLNRTILKDIKSNTGEVIASKNSPITLSTINKLRFYGKLKELMLNSK